MMAIRVFIAQVFPLLKKYHYPATIALVGNWMDGTEKPDEPGKAAGNLAASQGNDRLRPG